MRYSPAVFCLVAFLAFVYPAFGERFAYAQSVTASDVVVVPVVQQGKHLVASVRINNKPARLVVDTGATGNLLTPEAANRLGVLSGSAITVKGVSSVSGQKARINRLQVGDAELREKDVYIVAIPPELEADGLLGMPLFKEFIVTLDYANKRMMLSPPKNKPLLPNAAEIEIKQEKNNLVTVAGALMGVVGRYEIDTGNGGSLLLFEPFIRKNNLESRFTKRLKTPIGLGIGGLIQGQVIRLPAFTVGEKSSAVEMNGIIAELNDATEGGFTSDTLAGNIGAEIWSRFTVTFDLKHKKMYLERNADFNKPFAFNTTGIVALYKDGAMEILAVLADSPAQEAGLIIGDRIASINGIAVEEKADTPARLLVRRAPAGTVLTLVYRRKGDADRTATLTTRDLL